MEEGQTVGLGKVVYYSSSTGNTHKFVGKLGLPAVRVPVEETEGVPTLAEPFVLICPTYADGKGRGTLPKQVITFLNIAQNRQWIRGVVGCGNRNFGKLYAASADVIAYKCQVPCLHRVELLGLPEDVETVRNKVESAWKTRQ